MLKFKKTNYITVPRKEQDIPEGMWIKCDACGELLYKEDVVHNHYSCYKCGKYFRLSTKRRLRMVADKQSFEEWDTGLQTANPLEYPGYPEKLDGLKEKLHVVPGRMTDILTALEKKGLIIRQKNKTDKRVVDVVLTKEGEKEAARRRKEIHEEYRGLFEILGYDDAKELIRLLKILLTYKK